MNSNRALHSRSMTCPLAILKTKKVLAEIISNQELTKLSSSSVFQKDLAIFVEQSYNSLPPVIEPVNKITRSNKGQFTIDTAIQDVADNILGIVYRLSLCGGRHYVRISPYLLELGISPEKWGNDTDLHHQFCLEEDRPVLKKALAFSYKTGKPFQCDYRIKTQSDTTHWVNDKAKIVVGKDRRPLFMQGVMTEITNFKLLEAELMGYHNMVDKLVHQRTEMLERRLAILESCNASLGENYHKMHKMYLELLLKTQSLEAEI